MFTIQQFAFVHGKIKSGAEFQKYIKETKKLGATSFETWVSDGHTDYFGPRGFQTRSKPEYPELAIAEPSDKDRFGHYLKIHQQGETDHLTFCKQSAQTGIEK